jgi:hypothetical protein
MKMPFLEHVVRSYAMAQQLVERVRFARFGGARSIAHFDSLQTLSEAVLNGQVAFGDTVSGSGWLSPYAHWYLPDSYSPYQLSIAACAEGDRWAMRMIPAPAFLPAGQVPFGRSDSRLAFIYPHDTQGFALQLANTQKIPERERVKTSPEDNAWLVNIDMGQGGCDPEGWIYTYGDSTLSANFDDEDGNPLHNSAPILTDPTSVREIVTVPPDCQSVPVLLPPGYGSLLHQDVTFKARVVELDAETLSEMSRLGAPLTEKAYSLFYKPGATPPFCLQIESDKSELRQAPKPRAAGSTDLPSKIVTLLVEFFFEEKLTGVPVNFGDDELVEWFLPAIKDWCFAIGPYPMPLRWAGKVYGFKGPIYLYKTGTVEISISSEGIFSA